MNKSIPCAGIFSFILSLAVRLSAAAISDGSLENPCAEVTGMAGEWRGNGSTQDSISGRDAIQAEGITFAPGMVDEAFVFDQGTSFVRIGRDASYDIGAAPSFTVEGWIRPQETATQQPLLEWTDESTGTGYGMHLWLSVPAPYGAGAGCVYANLLDTSGVNHWITTPSAAIVANEYNHVALTYDSLSGEVRLFVNGRESAVKTVGRVRADTRGDIVFGRRVAGVGSGLQFAGALDEITLFPKALLSVEVQAIFAAGAAGKCILELSPDGLPVAWRRQHFGNDYAADPNAEAIADPDQDGANNYQEFFAGTSPVDAASVERQPQFVSTYAGSVVGAADGFRTQARFNAALPDLKLDNQGRLWILESSQLGYVEPGPGNHRIRILDQNGLVQTFSGSESGLVEGPVAEARYSLPNQIIFDASGSVYLLERANHRIRKIGPAGVVSTFVGSGQGYRDGSGTDAQFNVPTGMCRDTEGNFYVTDFYNLRIRKVTPAGVVSTYSGGVRGLLNGPVASAQFDSPYSIALGPDGSMFVADYSNGLIRRIKDGNVSTFAEGLPFIEFVAADKAGAVYASVAGGRFGIYKFNADGSTAWSLNNRPGYRNGPAAVAQFEFAGRVLPLDSGDLFVSDAARIRHVRVGPKPLLTVSPYEGVFTNSTEVTILSEVPGAEVRFTLTGAEPDLSSPLYVAPLLLKDTVTLKARLFVNGIPISAVAVANFQRIVELRDGIPADWRVRFFSDPADPRAAAAADPDEDGANNFQEYLAGTDPGRAASVKLEPVRVSTFAGSVAGSADGPRRQATFTAPVLLKQDPAGQLWVFEADLQGFDAVGAGGNRIRVMGLDEVFHTYSGGAEGGLIEGAVAEAQYRAPNGVVWDRDGNAFIADRLNHRIRKIDTNGVVSTFAGSEAGYQDGSGTAAKLHSPGGMAIDLAGNIYVADFENIRVRKVTPAGEVTTYAGSVRGSQDGPRETATFNSPASVVLGPDQSLYVSDWLNGKIRRIGPDGMVTTVASGLPYMDGLSIDEEGNLYASSDGAHVLAKFSPSGEIFWSIRTGQGFADGPIGLAKFGGLIGSPLVLSNGDFLVNDLDNTRIRRVDLGVRPLLEMGPDPGLYTNSVSVELATYAPHAAIRFTTDGSDPSASSPVYSEAIVLNESTTLKAALFVNETAVSPNAGGLYEIKHVPVPPVITGQPASLAVLVGGSIGLEVRASGTPPLAYQWSRNGTLLEGATGALLVITNAQPEHAGAYAVEVSNAQGSVTSASATVTVNTALAPPVITVQPESRNVPIGGSVTFTVEASGSDPFSYRWLKNGSSLRGAAGRSLVLENVQLSQAGSYSVEVRNSVGAVLSRPALLNVMDALAAPLIVQQPRGQGVLSGQGVALEVVATGVGPITYQWFRNGGAVPGAVSPVLSIASASSAIEGTYTVRVANSGGAVTSAPAILTVYTVQIGGTVVFANRATAFGLDAPIYDVDGVTRLSSEAFLAQLYGGPAESNLEALGPAVPFGTGDTAGYVRAGSTGTRSIPSVAPGAPAWVQIRAWEAGAGTTFESAREAGGKVGASTALLIPKTGGEGNPPTIPAFLLGLESFRLGQTPQVVLNGAEAPVEAGTTLTLSADVSGSGPFIYRWYFAGALIEGADSATYSVVAAQANSGEYWVEVSNAVATTTSLRARLAVLEPDRTAPVVSIASPMAGETSDERATLIGTAADSGGLQSVNWSWNGQAQGTLVVSNDVFIVSGLALQEGPNTFRVIARDFAGNETAAEVSVTCSPARTFAVDAPQSVREGARVVLPVRVVSQGDIGGVTLLLRYNSEQFRDPIWNWDSSLEGALKQANLGTAGQIRAAFALPAVALPGGTQELARVEFRARSVPEDLTSAIDLSILDIANPAGNRLIYGSQVHSADLRILKRKILGDNNANDRLDVGDGSVILRFLSEDEIQRTWDTSGNDLNQSASLDPGDVIRVLRVAAGIDEQPNVPALQAGVLAPRAPLAASSGAALLLPNGMRGAAGESVTLQVLLQNLDALAGASFSVDYPIEALRLIGVQSHRAGPIVPDGTLVVWNVAPSQNNYLTQSGRVSAAMSSGLGWAQANGVLAEVTFQIQAGAVAQYRWPVRLHTVEVTANGFDNSILPSTTSFFIGRDPLPPKLAPPIDVSGTDVVLTVQGEIGVPYRVQVSTDLKSWADLRTVTVVEGSIDVTDAGASTAPHRFYRVLQAD